MSQQIISSEGYEKSKMEFRVHKNEIDLIIYESQLEIILNAILLSSILSFEVSHFHNSDIKSRLRFQISIPVFLGFYFIWSHLLVISVYNVSTLEQHRFKIIKIQTTGIFKNQVKILD